MTFLLPCLALLCTLQACTSVELCPETTHPHAATILIDFDWHGYDANKDDGYFPQEMNIVAARNLNTLRVHGIANTLDGSIRNGMSDPIVTDSDNPEEEVPFRLKGGEYKAFAINATEGLELDSLHCYLTRPAATVDTLYLHMTETPRDQIEDLKNLKLPDFNPTYRYVQNAGRIFYGINTGISIQTGQEETIHFDMQPVTQEVKVKFSIKKTGDNKDRIEIEQVVAEMSGVCGRINIAEANLDTTNLYRMVFPFKDLQVEESEDVLTYSTSFYTLGIVPSVKKELLVGRGILQLAIRASVPKSLKGGADAGSEDKISLFFYAAANPRQTLVDAQMMEQRENKKTYLKYREEPVVIELGKVLEIDSGDILNATDEDTWHENEDGGGGNDNVDIEM